MNKQIKNIADIQSGLVLARKGAKQIELIKSEVSTKPSDLSSVKYKVLTLKSFLDDGIDKNVLDDFDSAKEIPSRYLTREGDIIVKLFEPIISCYIDKTLEDIIIPSQFAIIRCNNNQVLPGYVQACLEQKIIQKQLKNCIETGWQLRNIKTSSVGEITIPILPAQTQEKIIEVAKLQRKQYNLRKQLFELENNYNSILIEKIITKGE